MESQRQKHDQSITNRVLMIRPHNFRCNEMTSVNNYFQNSLPTSPESINAQALKEFDSLVDKLKAEGVEVTVVQDKGQNDTPDSVFPNNWITFHPGHIYNLYPLFAPNRRLERQIDVLQDIQNPQLFKDYSRYQNQNSFLQGTGSMVLDRVNKIAFAALSPRTHEDLFLTFCKDNGYQPVRFKAYHCVGVKRELIYHTNVMMWIGKGVCGVCLECIDSLEERQRVKTSLAKGGRTIVELTQKQIGQFAGNTLMLGNGKKIIVMSSTAFGVLDNNQKDVLGQFGKIVHCELETIQKLGGGSARCMLAEIY